MGGCRSTNEVSSILAHQDDGPRRQVGQIIRE